MLRCTCVLAALILTLIDAARIKSDVITSFKHIQAIDWNDGDSVETRHDSDQVGTLGTNHSRSLSSTVDPENITSIEFDRPAALQKENFTSTEFDRPAALQKENLTSIEFDNPITVQNENVSMQSQSVSEKEATVISTSDWNDPSSHATDNQTNALNSFPKVGNDEQQLSVSDHSEVANKTTATGQKIRSPPLTNLRNSSFLYSAASFKNKKTNASLPKASSESENKGEESNVILSVLDMDDFIPFTPSENEQIIQPILTARESQENTANGKGRRSRNKINAIEISGVITPRPSKRPNNTQSHHNRLQSRKKIPTEGSSHQTPQNSRGIRLNITASVINDSLSSTLNKDIQDSNEETPTDTVASESTIVEDDIKQPLVSDFLHDQVSIPPAYMWHSYMVPLDPAEILANDSVVSMFDFIDISNSTNSELEDGDTLFLPYGIIDTPYPLPVMMNNDEHYQNGSSLNSSNITESQSGYVPQRYDDLFVEGSNPFMSFYLPIMDQIPEGSTLTGNWANLPSRKSFTAPAAPRSFAEFALSYARALKHDDTSKKLPEKQRQSFQVFSVDEHGHPHAMEKEQQSREREQQKPLRAKGNTFWTNHRVRQKHGHRPASRNVTSHQDTHSHATHGKYETPSETAFHHFRTASIPFGFPEVPPYYSFKYDVQDLKGNYFGHEEVKDLLKTRGKYFVLLPDGRLQTVTYYANRTGYYPHVVYTDFAAHPDFRNFKRILIPKYPSSPIRPSTHSIVTPVPVIHHSTTLSPFPLTVSPTPGVIHKPNYFPLPQKYDDEELYIPNYLSRHWFRTPRVPSIIERPFPSIDHLHHGHAMPLLKPFHPALRHRPRHHQNSVRIVKAKVENVNDHIHFATSAIPHLPPSPTPLSSPLPTPPVLVSPTTTPLPPPFLRTTPLPTSTPVPPIPQSQRPPLPPLPIRNPLTTTPLPIPILPTTPSIHVIPKSTPRLLPNKSRSSVTTPIYPTTKKITVVHHHHHTTSLPPHSSFAAPTHAPFHPTLRPVPLHPPTPSPPIPHPHLEIPPKIGTLQPLHSVSAPHSGAYPLHSQLRYHIPGLSNLPFFSRRLPIIPNEPFMSMGLHHFSPLLPMHIHSHLHPDEIPPDHQAIGYLNAEHMILMNPRIHIFQPLERQQLRPHPVQTSLPSTIHGTFHFPDDSPYHHPPSVVSKVTPAPHLQRDKYAATVPKAYHSNPNSNQSVQKPPHTDQKQTPSYPKPNHSYTSPKPHLSDPNTHISDTKPYSSDLNSHNTDPKPYNLDQKPYHSDTIPENSFKDNKATSQITSVLDELAEYDEAAKDYL